MCKEESDLMDDKAFLRRASTTMANALSLPESEAIKVVKNICHSMYYQSNELTDAANSMLNEADFQIQLAMEAIRRQL
jgi:hypothetical protein